MWTVTRWFRLFLYLGETGLKRAIDLYNMGLLPDNARLALEAIDAVE